MERGKIYHRILQVYEDCDVMSFPIDCKKIIAHYGFKIYTYDELRNINTDLYDLCTKYSEDAFLFKATKIIAYNSKMVPGRIRFSLMHELGHYMLGHKSDTQKNEGEANFFASNILAPRIIMHYAICSDSADVEKIFGLSAAAAEYAFLDYSTWNMDFVVNNCNPSYWEKKICNHFYSLLNKKVIWRRKQCCSCHRMIYNSFASKCNKCHRDVVNDVHIPFVYKSLENYYETDMAFRIAENRYLYGE